MSITRSIKIRKAGGSLIATIPKEVVDAEGLEPGDVITATFQRRKEIIDNMYGAFPELGEWDPSETRGRERF